MPTILLTTMPGLGEVVMSEAQALLGSDIKVLGNAKTRAYDLSLLRLSGPSNDLLKIRTAEDVFQVLAEVPLSGQLSDLQHLSKLQLALVEDAYRLKVGLQRNKLKKRPSLRVIVQAEDVSWRRYRRIDIERAVTKSTLQLPGWQIVEDDADFEVWVQQADKRLLISGRLSKANLRHRDYVATSRPAALRPTVAAALCWLSEPHDDDVVLDPMCGSGTILLERAQMGRYKQILGGDIDPEAVQIAIENFGSKHKPWSLEVWDARSLPLENQSVDVIITNPPWGRKIGDFEQVSRMYPGVLKEMERVLAVNGRGVIITAQWQPLRKNLPKSLKITNTIKNVSVLGWHADIFVIRKS